MQRAHRRRLERCVGIADDAHGSWLPRTYRRVTRTWPLLPHLLQSCHIRHPNRVVCWRCPGRAVERLAAPPSRPWAGTMPRLPEMTFLHVGAPGDESRAWPGRAFRALDKSRNLTLDLTTTRHGNRPYPRSGLFRNPRLLELRPEVCLSVTSRAIPTSWHAGLLFRGGSVAARWDTAGFASYAGRLSVRSGRRSRPAAAEAQRPIWRLEG